jgi:hypothetical protein
MKSKILLFAAIFIALFFSQANAQIKKGGIWLGGQLNFYSQHNNYTQPNNYTTNNSNFSISPSIGKAIKDNLVAGIDLAYNYGKTSLSNIYSSTAYQATNNFGVGVYLRKYAPLGKNFYLFGQGRLGGTSLDTEVKDQSAVYSSNKGYSIDLGFYPGISYQVSKRVQLETGLNNLFDINLQHVVSKQFNAGSVSAASTSNTFLVSSSLSSLVSLTLGFRVLL